MVAEAPQQTTSQAQSTDRAPDTSAGTPASGLPSTLSKRILTLLAGRVLGNALDLVSSAAQRDLRRGGRMLAFGGIAIAFALAAWSQFQVRSAAPLGQPRVGEQGIATALSWFNDSASVAIGGWYSTSAVNGSRVDSREPGPLLRGQFASTAGRDNLRPAVQVLAGGVNVSDGNYGIALPSHILFTPGRLFAVDHNGYFIATGAASTKENNPRPDSRDSISPTGPDPNGIWQVGSRGTPPIMRTVRIGQSEAAVTALAFMPRAKLVAAGTMNGGVRLINPLSPNQMSDNEPVADDLVAAALRAEVGAHEAPILSLAAASGQQGAVDGFDLASIAQDRTIKVWRFGPDRRLTSLNVSFEDEIPDLVHLPDGLELSPLGETLLLRTPAGALYVARLVDKQSGGGLSSANTARAEMLAQNLQRPQQQQRQQQQPPDEEGRSQSQLQDQLEQLFRVPRFRVQLVVRSRDDAAAQQRALDDLRANPPRLPTGVPIFDEAAFQTVANAIGGRTPISILADVDVEESVSEPLRDLKNVLLSLLPSPLRLHQVVVPAGATAATLSADGRSVFVAGTDCMIREVDLRPVFASAQPRSVASVAATFSGHGDIVNHLAVSPDGAYLAAASLDRRVRIHRIGRSRTISGLLLADLPTGPGCASTQAIRLAGNLFQSQQVSVKFAGSIERQSMVAFARGLRGQGWNVQLADQGGERTAAAARINVVRYGSPEDESDARRLARVASDTSPAGRALTVERVETIAAGTLEVRVSN